MLTGVETQRLLSLLGNEAPLKAEQRKEGERGLLSLQWAACQSSSAGSRAICVLRCRLGLQTSRTKPQPVDFGLINRAGPESDQVWEVFTHIRLSFWFGLCCWDGHGDTGPTSCNTNFYTSVTVLSQDNNVSLPMDLQTLDNGFQIAITTKPNIHNAGKNGEADSSHEVGGTIQVNEKRKVQKS